MGKENNFKDSLILNEEDYKNVKNKFTESFLDSYESYNDTNGKEYLHNVVAAIILEHHFMFNSYDIHVPYRFKSSKSLIDKFTNYLKRPDTSTVTMDSNGNYDVRLKEFSDIFAMKIISYTSAPKFNSSDSELNKLINEKKENYELLTKMQEFENENIISDEFEKDKKYEFKATRLDYYKNCESVLTQIKTLISPEAVNLLKKYDELLLINKRIISLLNSTRIEDEIMDEEDLDTLNFDEILEDFSQRIHDKLDLAILTKQVKSVLTNSELLDKLGVKMLDVREKRTENGYVANFLIIKTLVGNIECQLQSKHEYEEGNYGYAAHTNLEQKYIDTFALPSLDSEEDINKFRNAVEFISPKTFLAQMDSVEKDRVLTQVSSKYQSYKNVVDQISDQRIQKFVLKHFGKLYPHRDKIFGPDESDMGFMKLDIEAYMQSTQFKELNTKAKISEQKDEAR